jgi:hypothetical protein
VSPDALELPGLTAVPPLPEPVVDLQAEPAPVPEPEPEPEHHLDLLDAETSEQLAEALDARTPLLKRAFGNINLP